MGVEDWEDDEDAQTYSEYLDDNPTELDAAYKQHVIADIVTKQKQKATDKIKAEQDKIKAEQDQIKANKKTDLILNAFQLLLY